MNILFFDVESTGLPRRDPDTGETHQPHITQLGFILERNGVDVMTVDTLIKPDNWHVYECSGNGISKIASELTGITFEACEQDGIPIADAVELFVIAAENADMIVCHNTAFDTKVMEAEYTRLQPRQKNPAIVFGGNPSICTMKAATPITKIAKKGVVKTHGVSFKWPKLSECMEFFFNEELENAHSAIVDIKATRRLFHKLIEIGALDKDVRRMVAAGTINQSLADEILEAA